jgi:Rad3-related DNA helicase
MVFLRNNCTTKKVGDKCPYIQARKIASKADSSLLNIEAFLANSFQNLWSPRKVLMIDEAHCLIDRAVSFFTVPINDSWGKIPKTLKKASTPMRFKSGTAESSGCISTLLQEYKDKAKEYQEEGLTVPKSLKYAIKYLSIDDMEWVLGPEKKELIPLKIMPILEESLFNYGEKVILLSATLSPNSCKELGLNSKNSVFIEIDSDFPIENNSINFIPNIGKLNKGNMNSKSDAIARAVLKARLENEGKRGIVHTVSYKNVEILKSALSSIIDVNLFPIEVVHKTNGNIIKALPTNKEETYTLEDLGFLFHTKDQSIEELLKTYSKKEGCVLVTPSLSEGFDGAGDLLEWQVILKCPYPYLGDPRIHVLMQSDFGKILFKERAIAAILQTLGRGIRTSTDTCKTYILDRNVYEVLGSCSRKSSKHYTSTSEAVKKIWKSRTTGW